MSVVYTPAQYQLPCSDGPFGRRCQSSLLNPMGYSIKVYGGICFPVDTVYRTHQFNTHRLVKTIWDSTHELVKPFLGKSFEIVVWPPSNPALGFPLPDRAFWPLCPRPEVLPSPELRPRPRRFCFAGCENSITSYVLKENSLYAESPPTGGG